MTTKLLVLFYASAMAVAIAGEAPSVSGSVKDPQGRPVASAAVSLFSRSSSAMLATTSSLQGSGATGSFRPNPSNLENVSSNKIYGGELTLTSEPGLWYP